MAQSLSTIERRPHDASLALIATAVVTMAVLTAVGAVIRVPLPHTPVPMTLQTLVVIVAGLLLGPRWGAASQLLYLTVGLCGLPLFAAGSPATMGYLISFAPAAWLAGMLAGPQRTPGRLILGATGATLLIFAGGVGWLAWWTGDVEVALTIGLLPFIGGAVIKLGLAVTIASGILHVSKRA